MLTQGPIHNRGKRNSPIVGRGLNPKRSKRQARRWQETVATATMKTTATDSKDKNRKNKRRPSSIGRKKNEMIIEFF